MGQQQRETEPALPVLANLVRKLHSSRRCLVLVDGKPANGMGTKPQRSLRPKNYSCGIAFKFGLVRPKTAGTLYL